MQHKGVSCGPLSFIHAAAACELPAWQSCRRVLLHPVDSCSHSSIRGPQSRAGAHLHKKYMDTFLTYVTVTTNLFLPWLWKPSYFKLANTTAPRSQNHYEVIHLRLLYHIYLWSADVCLCWQHGVIGVYIVHNVAAVVPCSFPTQPFWLLSRKLPHCTKGKNKPLLSPLTRASIFADMHKSPSACWLRGQGSEMKKQSRSNQPSPLQSITTQPLYSLGLRAGVGGGS